MRRFLILMAIVSSAWPVAPAHARDVLRLQPSTPWVLDYAEENHQSDSLFPFAEVAGEPAMLLTRELLRHSIRTR